MSTILTLIKRASNEALLHSTPKKVIPHGSNRLKQTGKRNHSSGTENGAEQNLLFITTFKRYQVQLRILDDLEKELRGVKLDIEKIIKAVTDGLYHESMKVKMDELSKEEADLTSRIDYVKRRAEAAALSREQIRDFMLRFKDIKVMRPSEQKEAVQLFVERVEVYDDRIDMTILSLDGKMKTAGRDADSLDLMCFLRYFDTMHHFLLSAGFR